MRAQRAVPRSLICRCIPTNGRRGRLPHLTKSPLSLILVKSSERRESVKGARLVRGLRTLDRFPTFRNLDPEGKGAGVSGGLPPGGV